MNRDNSRLMLKLEQHRRTINRETIKPEVRDLTLSQLTPIITMVAEVRAAYIKSVFDLSAQREGMPTPQQIASLHEQRLAYTELVHAVNALETAVARGYVEVSGAP